MKWPSREPCESQLWPKAVLGSPTQFLEDRFGKIAGEREIWPKASQWPKPMQIVWFSASQRPKTMHIVLFSASQWPKTAQIVWFSESQWPKAIRDQKIKYFLTSKNTKVDRCSERGHAYSIFLPWRAPKVLKEGWYQLDEETATLHNNLCLGVVLREQSKKNTFWQLRPKGSFRQRSPKEPQGDPGSPREPQGAPGGPRRPQGAPGSPREPQGAPGSPRRPQGAPGSRAKKASANIVAGHRKIV